MTQFVQFGKTIGKKANKNRIKFFFFFGMFLEKVNYLVTSMGGRKKQQGQQQHGNTRKFKVPGFTFRISSASPPQYATNKHQS
jgi:hypothetical protein